MDGVREWRTGLQGIEFLHECKRMVVTPGDGEQKVRKCCLLSCFHFHDEVSWCQEKGLTSFFLFFDVPDNTSQNIMARYVTKLKTYAW